MAGQNPSSPSVYYIGKIEFRKANSIIPYSGKRIEAVDAGGAELI
jgi:hypothetical protein